MTHLSCHSSMLYRLKWRGYEVYNDIMLLAETDDNIRTYSNFADIEEILFGCLYDIRVNSIREMVLNQTKHRTPDEIEQIIELRDNIINNILTCDIKNLNLIEDIKRHVNRETLTTLASTIKPGQKNNQLHKTIHYLHLFKEIKQIHEEKIYANQCDNLLNNVENNNHLPANRKTCLASLHKAFSTDEYFNYYGTEKENLKDKAQFCHDNTTSSLSKTGLHSRLARDISMLGNSKIENEPPNYLSYQKIEARFGNKGKKTHNKHYYEPSLTCHQMDGKEIKKWKASKTVATQLGLEKFYKQQRFDLLNLIDDSTEIANLPCSLENLIISHKEIDNAVNTLHQIKKSNQNNDEIRTLAQNMEDALRSYYAIYCLRINKNDNDNDNDNQLFDKPMTFTHNNSAKALSVNQPPIQSNSFQSDRNCIIL